MPNYLKMPKKQQILALLELGWSYRRIEAETGVRRETISGYDRRRRGNPAKTFPGSEPPPSADSPDHDADDGSNAAKTFAGSDPNPATTFAGSGPPARFAAARYYEAILEKRDLGLTVQRIWQDLTSRTRLSSRRARDCARARARRAVRAHARAGDTGDDHAPAGVYRPLAGPLRAHRSAHARVGGGRARGSGRAGDPPHSRRPRPHPQIPA